MKEKWPVNIKLAVVENGRYFFYPDDFGVHLDKKPELKAKLMCLIGEKLGTCTNNQCRGIISFDDEDYHVIGIKRETNYICLFFPFHKGIVSLFSIIIHEIKNPLAAIKAMTQVMIDGIERQKIGNDRVVASLRRIDDEIDRINRIFKSTIQLAKPGSRSSLKFNLTKTVRNTVSFWKDKFEENNISIFLETGSDELGFVGNPDEISQILTNLISNAVSAVESIENPRINIELIEKEESMILLKVEDNGKGMDKAVLASIKESLYTAGSEGLGIGLYIVKMLVEKNFGVISVQSSPRRGTSVEILFYRN